MIRHQLSSVHYGTPRLPVCAGIITGFSVFAFFSFEAALPSEPPKRSCLNYEFMIVSIHMSMTIISYMIRTNPGFFTSPSPRGRCNLQATFINIQPITFIQKNENDQRKSNSSQKERNRLNTLE